MVPAKAVFTMLLLFVRGSFLDTPTPHTSGENTLHKALIPTKEYSKGEPRGWQIHFALSLVSLSKVEKNLTFYNFQQWMSRLPQR
mmetsp:Transcript_14847/g.33693  ORF Transcript_14847/g.33693 Transcript_14847/m.33693 type:complete len:85 (+) Transcript_14847:737-991(+)